MSAFVFFEVDKSTIQHGDVILHNGKEMTVCSNNITRSSLMGICIFGDSYNLGYKKVLRGVLKNVYCDICDPSLLNCEC